MTEREDLINSLRGSNVHITNLYPSFDGWPVEVHSQVDRLREHVDQRLDSVYHDHPKLSKLKASDFGLFGATWWPRTSFERLRVATDLSIWLFTWDDEIDTEDGSVAHDFSQSQKYREDTTRFVRKCLKIPPYEADGEPPSSTIIKSFKSIGEDFCRLCNRRQRQSLFNEIGQLIDNSEVEQSIVLNGQIPTVEEYWQYRLGTSAVRVALAITEFSIGLNLPFELRHQPDVEQIWYATNAIISIVNDIFSVKKELAHGSVDSLVPILYSSTKDAQIALDETIEMLKDAIHIFDMAAERLVRRQFEQPMYLKAIRSYIDGCRFYCTGNLKWSLATGRYRVGTADESGNVDVAL